MPAPEEPATPYHHSVIRDALEEKFKQHAFDLTVDSRPDGDPGTVSLGGRIGSRTPGRSFQVVLTEHINEASERVRTVTIGGYATYTVFESMTVDNRNPTVSIGCETADNLTLWIMKTRFSNTRGHQELPPEVGETDV